MKTLLTLIIVFLLLISQKFYSQYQVDFEINEPDMPTLSTPQQPGGRYITSIAENGQYLRVLLVFVQFKDDNWNPTWSIWPKGSSPTTWMGTNTIDQLITQNSTNQNLTHYYTEMSLGHFKVIGNTYHIITPNTRDEYITMGYNRGDINKQLLSIMDNYINFSAYDK